MVRRCVNRVLGTVTSVAITYRVTSVIKEASLTKLRMSVVAQNSNIWTVKSAKTAAQIAPNVLQPAFAPSVLPRLPLIPMVSASSNRHHLSNAHGIVTVARMPLPATNASMDPFSRPEAILAPVPQASICRHSMKNANPVSLTARHAPTQIPVASAPPHTP